MSKRKWGDMMGVNLGFNPRFSYNPTYTTTRTYAGGGAAGGVKFSKEQHKVGRRRRKERIRMYDLMQSMHKLRVRWQLMSGTLTGPGRIPIGYGGYSGTDLDFHSMPIHLMSLTQNSLNPTLGGSFVNGNKGAYAHGLYKVVRSPGDGTCGLVHYVSNTHEGINNYSPEGYWQVEAESALAGGYAGTDSGSHFHKWSEVRMNLYGAKHIPLTYTISVVQVPKEFDPFQHPPSQVTALIPPVGNQPEFSEFSRWIEDISRSIISNPLNITGTRKEYKTNIRVLKQYKINIQPLSYTNAAAEGTAAVKVGNVREFKMFMRHDRWRNYCWAETDATVDQDRNFADLGWDVKVSDNPVTEVKWGGRLLMMITCTTGGIRDGQQNDVRTHNPVQLTDIPEDYGSYDIIVRNEFRVHT